jgi:hypothetical protein
VSEVVKTLAAGAYANGNKHTKEKADRRVRTSWDHGCDYRSQYKTAVLNKMQAQVDALIRRHRSRQRCRFGRPELTDSFEALPMRAYNGMPENAGLDKVIPSCCDTQIW